MTGELCRVDAPARQEPTLLDIIRDVACNPKADVGKLERLLAIQQQQQAREAETAFNRAMKDAQSEMAPIVRDTQNVATGSMYAKLETIDQQIRPIYNRYGFCLTFNSPVTDSTGVTISCSVLHEGGHSKPYQISGALDDVGMKGSRNKTPIQALISSTTYLRRCLECLIFNIVLIGQDKDGNKAGAVITQEQADTIESLIAELGMTPAAVSAFLEIMEAKLVSEIKADRGRQAIRLLDAKRKRAAEK